MSGFLEDLAAAVIGAFIVAAFLSTLLIPVVVLVGLIRWVVS